MNKDTQNCTRLVFSAIFTLDGRCIADTTDVSYSRARTANLSQNMAASNMSPPVALPAYNTSTPTQPSPVAVGSNLPPYFMPQTIPIHTPQIGGPITQNNAPGLTAQPAQPVNNQSNNGYRPTFPSQPTVIPNAADPNQRQPMSRDSMVYMRGGAGQPQDERTQRREKQKAMAAKVVGCGLVCCGVVHTALGCFLGNAVDCMDSMCASLSFTMAQGP